MTVLGKSVFLVLLSLSILVLSCAPKVQKPIEPVDIYALPCDVVACESGEACCDADKICTENENVCINESLVERCYPGEKASYEVCESDEFCADGECHEEPAPETRSPDEIFLDYEMSRESEGESLVEIPCGDPYEPCLCDSDEECSNIDLWDGEYCDNGGQCASKVLKMVREVTAANPTVELSFHSKYPSESCFCQILWGDESAGTDVTKAPQMTDCSKVENRTHVYSKAGRYDIKITDTARCPEPMK